MPTIQLVFIDFYLGIARGALETGAGYTRTSSRSWLHSDADRAVDEPYQLDLYGDYASKLWTVEALADRVAEERLALHRDAWNVTERQRSGATSAPTPCTTRWPTSAARWGLPAARRAPGADLVLLARDDGKGHLTT